MLVSRSAAALALAGTVSTAVAGIAFAGAASAAGSASPPTSIHQAVARAERTLARDSFVLRLYTYVVKADPAVSAADRDALLPGLTSAGAAVQALRSTVKTETTIDAVNADLATLDADHLADFVLPQSALVVRADDVTAAVARAAQLRTALASRVGAAQSAGKDVTAATALLDELSAKVGDAGSVAGSVHDAVLALTVAGAPDNAAALKTNATGLKTAFTDLWTAARDAAGVERALNPGHSGRHR